jgi:hypothetical protein
MKENRTCHQQTYPWRVPKGSSVHRKEITKGGKNNDTGQRMENNFPKSFKIMFDDLSKISSDVMLKVYRWNI